MLDAGSVFTVIYEATVVKSARLVRHQQRVDLPTSTNGSRRVRNIRSYLVPHGCAPCRHVHAGRKPSHAGPGTPL